MKIINVFLALLLGGILLAGFQNCAPPTKFTATQEMINASMSYNHTSQFKVSAVVNSKVDILFVIDNSGSMAEEQAKIAQVFSGFIAQVSHMNWRIAITTTDTSSQYGDCIKGNLCVMQSSPSPVYFIDASTPNVNSVFMNKIQVGLLGSGTELGLTAIQQFLVKSAAGQQSFIRPDAAFVTIVVTDSEETSSLNADVFLQNVKSLLPQGKKYVNHSSIVLPGDNACKALNAAENKFAQKYYDVTVATGGVLASICEQNYASAFQLIADTTIGKVAQQNLDCAVVDKDKDNQLDILITNSQGQELHPTLYEVSENKIIFTPALEKVGDYKVSYSCAQ